VKPTKMRSSELSLLFSNPDELGCLLVRCVYAAAPVLMSHWRQAHKLRLRDIKTLGSVYKNVVGRGDPVFLIDKPNSRALPLSPDNQIPLLSTSRWLIPGLAESNPSRLPYIVNLLLIPAYPLRLYSLTMTSSPITIP